MTNLQDSKPYLAIKNWEKHQSDKTGKPMSWMKDYADQTINAEYSRLTLFQRGLLQECRRLRARTAHHLHNDITWIARATCVVPTDRPHLTHALLTLISRGFLIPVESEDSSIEESREEKKKEEKRRIEPLKKEIESFSKSADPQYETPPAGTPPPKAGHRWVKYQEGWQERAI